LVEVKPKEESSERPFSFEIPISIGASLLNAVARSITIGIFVAIPSILAAFAAGKLAWTLVVLMLLSGALAGAASTWNLTKSV
jgi:hypothetical protein